MADISTRPAMRRPADPVHVAGSGPERIEVPALGGVRHGFFTRRGGTSSEPFDSLNCGLYSGDNAALVAENRRRCAAALGVDAVVTARQVHGPGVVVLDRVPRAPIAADALVTGNPAFAIGVLVADCAPVLMHEREAGLVAAAHAGWRGALNGVLERTVAAIEMQGGRRDRITAIVGPCIGPQSYEVGPGFPGLFRAAAPVGAEDGAFFRKGRAGHWWFDLPGYVVLRLERASVGHAVWTGEDTYGEPERFFSHRRGTHQGSAECGRNLAAIRADD